MVFRALADATVAVHLAFVGFVLLGGLLALRRPRVAWLHLPAVSWAAWVEFTGSVCPLTPLENWLREQGGGAAYGSGFVEHYLVPILYPASLSRELQWGLGSVVLVLNALVYTAVIWRAHGRAVPPW
jgi:hypothetical protein